MHRSYPQNKALLYQKQALIEVCFAIQNQAMIEKQKDKQRDGNALLAQKIRTAIADGPLTAKEIATRCEVSPQAVNGWKKTGRISKDMLGRLAGVLGLEPSYFISGWESSPNKLKLISSREPDLISAKRITKLIELFAQSTEEGQGLIIDAATHAPKLSRDNGLIARDNSE